jgi:uncharacterized protein with NRDE domain
MCLAIIALNCITEWPLIVIANRDEQHSRPTLPACPWIDAIDILGGRDLNAGGTWLGMTATGRFALLTNFREPGRHDPRAPSRGQLTEHYLRGESFAQRYAQELQERSHVYNGFNLLVGDDSGLWFSSNRGEVSIQKIETGVIGVSNASLNTPWPKLNRTKNAISELLSLDKYPVGFTPDSFFDIMLDTRPAYAHELPETGVGPEREKLLSSPFIKNEHYGTRCTTLIMQRSDGLVRFQEKRFNSQGQGSGESCWTIDSVKQEIAPGTQERFGF